jgi:NTP pyrophosphatase (non-canonical NTP hydrolase)
LGPKAEIESDPLPTKTILSCSFGKRPDHEQACQWIAHTTSITIIRRLTEQAEVEATEEYQLEQLLKELEDILDALDAIAQEADERDALRLAGLNA